MMDENGYQRILVAMDFSAHSEAAFLQAVWLARTQGASIVLVHTLPDLRQVAHRASALAKLDLLQGEGEIFQREVRQVSDAKMRQLIQKHRAEDLDIKVETLLGEPFVELIHAVQSEGYDLVLAGTRGMAGWQQFLVGSTASRLIRKCPASVWVVKDEHIGPPKVVLTATDFSTVGWKAVKRGALIAKNAKASMHLLHVIDEGDIPKSLFDSKSRQEIIDSVERRLYDGLESSGVDRDDVTLHLSTGTPWQEVARLSKHLSVDLIAMGTVGRNGIPGLLLGNTAEKVLNTCDCSILAVKPDNFVSPIEPASWPLHPPNEGNA
jgi:universal stress protein E